MTPLKNGKASQVTYLQGFIVFRCDSAGVTTYYEYDDFGRLKNVRNDDDNITGRNYYHYYDDPSSDFSGTSTSNGTLNLNTYDLIFDKSGSSLPFSVTSDNPWTAASDSPSWLSLSPSSGTGNGTVTASAATNSGDLRYGKITITAGSLSKTVNVSQYGSFMLTPLTDYTLIDPDWHPYMSQSQISLWYLVSPDDVYNCEEVSIEGTEDPYAVEIEVEYNSSVEDWLDVWYEPSYNWLDICLYDEPTEEDWALITITSGTAVKYISVKYTPND